MVETCKGHDRMLNKFDWMIRRPGRKERHEAPSIREEREGSLGRGKGLKIDARTELGNPESIVGRKKKKELMV